MLHLKVLFVHDLLSHHATAERDNATMIMTIWWTSRPPILQIHLLHQVATGTSSHVPLRRRAIIVAIFHGSGTCGMFPGTVQWGALLVWISDLLIWRIFQFFRPLEVTISKFRHWHRLKKPRFARFYWKESRKQKQRPHPWDTHYQFSIKTLLSNYAQLQLFFARNAGRRGEHFEGNWSWEKFRVFESAKSINDGRDILV